MYKRRQCLKTTFKLMINIRLCILIVLTESPSLKQAILHLCSGGLKNYIFSHSSYQGNMRRATNGKIYFLHLMEQISDSCNSFDPPFYCRHKHCTVGSSVGSQPGQGEGTCPGVGDPTQSPRVSGPWAEKQRPGPENKFSSSKGPGPKKASRCRTHTRSGQSLISITIKGKNQDSFTFSL